MKYKKFASVHKFVVHKLVYHVFFCNFALINNNRTTDS